jgi:glycosyltransferase involved in cell wall biosynthesis
VRVAFVLHSAKRDGAGNAAVELLASLRQHDIEAYVLLPTAGPLEAELRAYAAAVRVIPYRWWIDRGTPAWKRVLRTTWNLAMAVPVTAVLRRWKCDVVYTNTLTISVGAFAARLLHLSHVWHIHELFGGGTGLAFDLGEKRSLRLMNSLADAFITVSAAAKAQFLPYMPSDRIRVIYQSVSVPNDVTDSVGQGETQKDGPLVCVVLGSLFPLKRQKDAIKAIGLLHRQGVGVELSLVGEGKGKFLSQLHDLVRSEEVESQVRFLGFLKNPFPVLRAADVVLACSPVEACSRAIVEGMLLGKPVVAARGGGNSELVQNGFNGLLYKPYEPDALADCIRQLATNPAERQRMGENARRWAEPRFTRERYAHEVLEVLASVLPSRQAGTQEKAP